MRGFLVIWFGQAVSQLGSALSRFGLGVWLFQKTDSVGLFALLSFAAVFPQIVLASAGGLLADRYDRRRLMLAADTLDACRTGVLAALWFGGRLEIWHVLVSAAVSSSLAAFQEPAFGALVPSLVPRDRLARANGLLQLAQVLPIAVAPAIAGVAVAGGGVTYLLLVDLASFGIGALTLIATASPVMPPSPEPADDSLRRRALAGWRFVHERPGLRGLLWWAAATNLCTSTYNVLVTPMVLAFLSASAYGVAASVAGVGMVAGGLLSAAWGGPRRRVVGLMSFNALCGVALITSTLRPSIVFVTLGMAIYLFCFPLMGVSSSTLWQTKVPHHLQGRVMAVRQMIAWSSIPVAYLALAPAARWFEPLMARGGSLAGSAGRVMGTGAGRGTALWLAVLGGIVILTSVIAILVPRIRDLEAQIPDAPVPTAEVAPAAPG